MPPKARLLANVPKTIYKFFLRKFQGKIFIKLSELYKENIFRKNLIRFFFIHVSVLILIGYDKGVKGIVVNRGRVEVGEENEKIRKSQPKIMNLVTYSYNLNDVPQK